jgi:integrase/recombinase XerD
MGIRYFDNYRNVKPLHNITEIKPMNIALVASTQRMIEASARKAEVLDFMRWLQDQRYRDYPIDCHLRQWLFVQDKLNSRRTADGKFIDQSLHAVFLTGRRRSVRRYLYDSTRRAYRQYLLSQGRLIEPPPAWYEPVLVTYDRYLLEVRGLSDSSRYQHGHTIRLLLAKFNSVQALKRLTREDVEQFVERRSKELSRHSMQHVVGALRAFLRYAHDVGLILERLDSLDRPRTYRGELPPRAIPWGTVLKLLSSIDTKSRLGWRDLTLLHLIAHYGLRPSEAVGLKIDSIDFDRSLLRVDQTKTRSTLMLPLHAHTVKVLKTYLRKDRLLNDFPGNSLFLRGRCPDGPLRKHGVGDVFEKRMREANLPGYAKQVYRLRHSLAMRLLSRGVGIKAIGDVLGHRSFLGTSAYLRLDIVMLRDVALEVPSEGGTHG